MTNRLRITFFIICTIYGSSIMAGEDTIFKDTFDTNTIAKWQDMKVWGFSMWRIVDGVFESSSDEGVSDGIFTAAPVLENVILNRDYSVLFRLKAIEGENYLFSIGI